MDRSSIEKFIELVKDNRMVSATRWHLTITSLLHKLAYEDVPGKLRKTLPILGGSWKRAYTVMENSIISPYPCDPLTLMSIFKEKLQDRVFRRSFCDQLLKLPTPCSTKRLLSRLLKLGITT